MSDLDNEEIEATRLLKNINEKELDELIKSTEGSIEETCKFLKYPVVAIVQEKSADEMFEEIGYSKIYCTLYNGLKQLFYKKATIEITFYKDKTFGVADLGGYYTLDMQELKAINKKCKELGWI